MSFCGFKLMKLRTRLSINIYCVLLSGQSCFLSELVISNDEDAFFKRIL